MTNKTEKTAEKQQVGIPFKKGEDERRNMEGRPKGTISIKTEIKKRLKENPERFDELVEYYMKEETPVMRKLLWEMIDGKPKETSEVEVKLPKPIMDITNGVQKDNSDK